MNLLDRAIGLVAPGAALRRAQARAAMAMLARSYEGARIGRRTEGWVVAGTSANAEIGTALVRLRDRSRDLVRNNPYAAKAVSAVVSNLVGTGIMPRARSGDGTINEMADRLWARFAEACDADGLTDFSGLQALIVRTLVESGECLVRIRERRAEDGLPVPLQLQLLEPDHLDASKTGEAPGGGFVIQGVEFDALGRRRAYWLYPVHPGEVAMFRRASLVSQPVPAASVVHLFDRLRPGQVRGVPWFAPVILKMRDLDEYDDAELVRKKIEACFAAFVTGSDDEETLGRATSDANGRRIESFEPGMIEYLSPGKDVKFATPSHAGGYGEYMRVQLHAIAAGVGLTYELLTGDLSQVNYSSIRAGLIEFRRRMEALQWQLLVPGLCRPVWQRFVATSQAIGALPDEIIDAEWTAPRFEAVDPLKDIQADILAVRAGLMTLKEAVARQGYDPAHVLAEIAATNAELDGLGIVLDTDPRKATKTGAPKPLEEAE
ncbi:MAG: phage portal protein [Defluviicoccus sp.]|nr:phage portal protein [Defluviicoccus sp.]MDG4591716.1 phage portal protein [Defluviicoccus sp.]MDG4601440.1 phage portal protein [Defluviicoccus sp.]